jgi:putative two-component system response regulator
MSTTYGTPATSATCADCTAAASADEALLDMRLLIVDDNPVNTALLEQLLGRSGFRAVRSTDEPGLVPELCLTYRPDLILLDIHMPKISGLDVLRMISAYTRGVDSLPVLVVTADTGREVKHQALEAGARDFVTKPIDGVELMLRVRTHLLTRHLQRECSHRNDRLEVTVRERTFELEQSRLESLTVLASVCEYHDDQTAQHTQRVGNVAGLIALELGQAEGYVDLIRRAAPLHDLGKIAIDRHILTKPGRLTDEEREAMQEHVARGSDMLSSARSPVLSMAREIALTHHERWDGEGYLRGMRAEAIPLSGRITAIADVYDALTHQRPYKEAWPVERAVELIAVEAGRQFDPDAVAAFLALVREGAI